MLVLMIILSKVCLIVLVKSNAVDNKTAISFLLDVSDLVDSMRQIKGAKKFEEDIHNALDDYIKCYQLTQRQNIESVKLHEQNGYSSATSINIGENTMHQLEAEFSLKSVSHDQENNSSRSYLVYWIIAMIIVFILAIAGLYLLYGNTMPQSKQSRRLVGIENGNIMGGVVAILNNMII